VAGGEKRPAGALTEMRADGDISRARAEEVAPMVLRDNAVTLYRLTP
jgi:hypothetical protein